jgi:hypothetical protein
MIVGRVEGDEFSHFFGDVYFILVFHVDNDQYF